MGSPLETKAAAILFPVAAADLTGRTGVYCYAANTSVTSVTLPTAMKNNFLRFRAVGCTARVAVSSTARALTLTTTSTVGAESALSAASVADGETVEGIVLKTTPVLNFVCSNTTGYVEFFLSEVLGSVLPGA